MTVESESGGFLLEISPCPALTIHALDIVLLLSLPPPILVKPTHYENDNMLLLVALCVVLICSS